MPERVSFRDIVATTRKVLAEPNNGAGLREESFPGR